MSVRDRFDVGEKKQQADTQRAQWVRDGLQENTALHTIERASLAIKAGTAGPFEVDLVASWHELRRAEGW